MSESLPPPETADRRPRRVWLTIGELVAVAGLVLAGLNYWDNHKERARAEHERVQAPAPPQPRASVLVLRGSVDAEGTTVTLEPMAGDQAVQTQRYVFPRPVTGQTREIDAGRLHIDLGWFEDGLKGQLKAARRAGGPLPREGELPVGVETTYVDGGETHVDRSIYRVGYEAAPGFLGAVKLRATGLSLVRRGVGADLQAAVDARWNAVGPKAPEKDKK